MSTEPQHPGPQQPDSQQPDAPQPDAPQPDPQQPGRHRAGLPADADTAEAIRSSTPGSGGPQHAAGGMGVSSERVGHAGPGQEATDGLRQVAPHERYGGADAPPEQAPGDPEQNPVGLPPKAGYSSRDPRSDDEV